jgi:hypothetical protein
MNRTATRPLPSILPLSSDAYLSTSFDAVFDRFRPELPDFFKFEIRPDGNGGVEVVTNHTPTARRIIEALEAAK